MGLTQHIRELLGRQLAVVQHRVLQIGQVGNQREQLLGISLAELRLAHHVALRVVLTESGIGNQTCEVRTLIGLGILAGFQDQAYILVVGLLVGLGVSHHAFEQCQRLRHLRLQTAERDVQVVGMHVDRIVAGQVVELLLHLGSRELVGSHIVEIAGSDVVTVVVLLAELIAEHDGEEVVLCVLLIVKRQFVLGLSDDEILLEIHELRMDGLHLRLLDLLHEGAHLVTICLNRGDGRLVDLLLGRVHARLLIDGGIACGEETVGEGHDLLLGHLRHTVQLAYLLLPGDAVDKGIHKLTGAPLVALEGSLVVELHIVDHTRQEIVGEVTLLQVLDLGQHQVSHLLERLLGLGHTYQDERGIVLFVLEHGASTQHLHLLVQVDVEDTRLAIVQHIADHVEGITLQVGGFLGEPAHPHVLCLLTYDGSIHGGSQRLLDGEHRLRNVGPWLPTAEILVDDGDGLVHIEVARHTDGHIVGHIPLLEVVLDIGDRGILQVLLRTDGGLCAIRMGRRELLAQSLPQLVAVIRQIDIILLIHRLELGMEAANHHILETVALDLSPVLNLVAGDILRIAGHIVRGEGVGSFSTDSGHQLVVLVGDEVLGCHLRDAVDLMVFLLAGLGIRQSAVFLVALFDLVEQGCFGSHVVRAEMGSALKHQVLQIVRQTGGLCRIVLRTCTHGDIGLNARTLRVH